MAKRLFILRHAKSDWNDADLPDHDRPLNERGKLEAPRVGKMLRQTDRVPDLIVSSTAKRARKTAEKVADACSYEGTILQYAQLYNASIDQILQVLRSVPNDPQSLMVVAHNPGLEGLASTFAKQAITMPTAALADLQIEIGTWDQLSFESGAKLLELWTARDHNDGHTNTTRS